MFHGRIVIDRMTGEAVYETQDTDGLGAVRWVWAEGVRPALIRQGALRYLVAGRELPARAVKVTFVNNPADLTWTAVAD